MNAPPLPTLDRATSKSATQQVKPPSGFRPSLQLTAGKADTCRGASVNPFSTGSAANRSSSRRSLLKEAVRRSQALSASDAAEHITSQPDRDPSRGPPKSGSTGVWCGESSTQQLAVPSLSGASSDGGSGLSSSGEGSQPTPLFPPTTLIIGDSITRHLRFVNVITRCLPGALVTDVLVKLLEMLPSLPSSITRIIVHVGSNDSARCKSEPMKNVFNTLISFLKQCGKTVFISGPIPILGHGDERFSRLLSLNTWLRATCWGNNVGFIDNFDAFWNRESLYSWDGLHLSAKDSCVLAANCRYTATHHHHVRLRK